MAKLLVVDDDPDMSEDLKTCLESSGYLVDTHDDGVKAAADLKAIDYDLLILDWDMPGMTGVELCRHYRNAGGSAPVLMLTAKARIEDKGLGFDSGADDYLTKPFEIKELLMRVKALLKRPREIVHNVLSCKNIEIDPVSRETRIAGELVELRLKEYQVLELLMRHPNRVFSTEEIALKLWSTDEDVSEDAVRVTITRLRKKLSAAGDLIETVYGAGYKLQKN